MAEMQSLPHQLILNDRRQLTVNGVSDVDSFDDTAVIAHTSLGELTIKGHELHICRLNIEAGDLSLEGRIDALEYSQTQSTKGGVFRRLFK